MHRQLVHQALMRDLAQDVWMPRPQSTEKNRSTRGCWLTWIEPTTAQVMQSEFNLNHDQRLHQVLAARVTNPTGSGWAGQRR